MTDYPIEVTEVYKKFNTRGRSTTFKDLISYHEKRKKTYNNVLNDVSFKVKKGEILGIIGRNGSGKSTMLKLLSGILSPNSGTIKIDGKVACLIELGAGFHPDMTGRENIFINASIFGIPEKTVKERLDSIIEFSGIGDYIDERIRTYSSGMYLRLAFSVAINVDADILLIDEILAVGDYEFQNKCLNKIDEFRKQGGTIVFVTHNIGQAKQLCDKIIWLDKGHIKEYGEPKEVCAKYIAAVSSSDENST